MRRHRGIVLVGLDPYLALRVQRRFPQTRVVAVHDGDELDHALAQGRIAAFAVDVGSPLVSRIAIEAGTRPVIAVGSAEPVWGARATAPGLTVPVSDADLADAITRVIGPRPLHLDADPLQAVTSRWLPAARVVAATLAIAPVLADPSRSDLGIIVAAATTAFAALRITWLSQRSRGWWLDVALGTILLFLTGGAAGPYVAFALVAVAGVSATGPATAAAVAAGAVVLAAAAAVLAPLGPAAASLGRPAATVLFVFQTAVVAVGSAVLARTYTGDRDLVAMRGLDRTSRALVDLRDATREGHDGLTLPEVARRLVEDATARWELRACLLLAPGGDGFRESASTGLPSHDLASLEFDADRDVSWRRPIRMLTEADVPAPLAATPNELTWWLVALRMSGVTEGVLLLGTELPVPPTQRVATNRFSRRAALAIRNARGFSDIQGLTRDVDRRELAKELDRSLVQDVVHLRLELELLARSCVDPGLSSELWRLVSVATNAQAGVRGVVADLNGSAVTGGLAAALRDYCRALDRGTTPAISVHDDGSYPLSARQEARLFSTACEALQVSLRHDEADRIDVHVDADRDGVVVEIRDDGGLLDGHDQRAFARRRATQMLEERAARSGLRLEVETTGWGNVLRVRGPADSGVGVPAPATSIEGDEG